MPAPANDIERTIGEAFTLLHGNPPRGVKHRGGMFTFKGQAAQDYKHLLTRYVWQHNPAACKTRTGMYSPTLATQARNRCLRYIMGVPQ